MSTSRRAIRSKSPSEYGSGRYEDLPASIAKPPDTSPLVCTGRRAPESQTGPESLPGDRQVWVSNDYRTTNRFSCQAHTLRLARENVKGHQGPLMVFCVF